MTVRRMMSMEEFADHEGSAKRERVDVLDWREDGADGDGSVDVWLVSEPWAMWRNTFLRVVSYENKEGEKVEKIVPLYWNTMELIEDPKEKDPEKIVKRIKQQGYYLDSKRDESERTLAELDPFLKTLEWIRTQILEDKIDWLDKIFEFEAADSEDRIIRAAGMLGIYPQSLDDLEDQSERERFKKLKINLKESFKESSRLRLQYGFVVAKNESPEDGFRIAIETETIGNLIKRIYKDRKTAFKGDAARANVIRQLCMRWSYDKAKSYSDAYHITPLTEEKPSDDVKAVFEKFDAEPPDLSQFMDQSNVALLEHVFRKHWVHDVVPPWDEIFEAAYEKVKGTPAATLPESFDFGANAREGKKPEVGKKEESKSEKIEDGIPCEACGKTMPDDALTCPHCNAKYSEFAGFIALEEIDCKACGKKRPFAEAKCPHCGREYELGKNEKGEDAIVLKPEAKKEEEPRASRRRVPKS